MHIQPLAYSKGSINVNNMFIIMGQEKTNMFILQFLSRFKSEFKNLLRLLTKLYWKPQSCNLT